MKVEPGDLIAIIQAQMATLSGLAQCQGMDIDYVKPHGALYNDMMTDESLLHTVMQALATYHRPVPLMLQAVGNNQMSMKIANKIGISCIFEAFADRAYQSNGLLTPRKMRGAVHTHELTLAQAQNIFVNASVKTIDGDTISVFADSLCVHSDTPDAVLMCEEIRRKQQFVFVKS